jgi:hypothetical protein
VRLFRPHHRGNVNSTCDAVADKIYRTVAPSNVGGFEFDSKAVGF